MRSGSFGSGGNIWGSQGDDFDLGTGDERFGNAFENKHRVQAQNADTNVNRANAYQNYQEGLIQDRMFSNNIAAQKNPFYGDASAPSQTTTPFDQANDNLARVMGRGIYTPQNPVKSNYKGIVPINQEQRAANAKSNNAGQMFMKDQASNPGIYEDANPEYGEPYQSMGEL